MSALSQDAGSRGRQVVDRVVCCAALLVGCGAASSNAPLPERSEQGARHQRPQEALATPPPPSPPAADDIDVDGHAIRVWSKVVPDEQAVIVLVHGRTWSALPDFDLQVEGERRSLMDALQDRRISSYAVDLRGYGGTARDTSGWLTPDRASADLEAVLMWIRERHNQTPVVLGWSYGSLVAHLHAQEHPSSQRALVLFGYPRPIGHHVEPTPTPASPERRRNTAEAAAEDFITPGTMSEAAIEEYVRASLAADPVRVDWKDLHQFNRLDPRRVSIPTLIIHGERDPYAPLDRQTELLEALGTTNKALVTLPGTDHAAHLEALPEFTNAVLEFLELE